jgi:cytochrome c oxidase subunit II
MNLQARIGAVVVGALVVTGALCVGESKAKPAGQKIEIVASRFSFSPSEITIKKGETVTISVSSADVTHGLVIPALGVKADIKKGKEEDVNVTAQTVGTFQGKCAHFCGKGHGSMIFTVHVVE